MSGLIPQHFIDDLIARADIVEVLGRRISLKKAGREFKAVCPFHDEKTPSFTVSPHKGFYHCFGCGAHGTALGFLMEHDHMSFVEAVESLASMMGVEVPREDGERPAQRFDELYALLGEVERHYQAKLVHSDAAREYLKGRGIDGATAKRFGIGYAPDGWSGVLDRFGGSEEKIGRLLAAGLVIRKDTGQHYDRFRERIMFPIRDARGRTVGFGGRVPGQGEPKYLNSPETVLFHKGRELYGLYEARQALRSIDRLVVVEGYMDVVGLARHGIDFSVATLGTATTDDHLNRLFRLTDNVLFCFDGDRAGRAAAWRALENALSHASSGRQIGFVFLPDGQDPDSLVKEHGISVFEQYLDSALALSDFLVEELSGQVDMATVDGATKFTELAKPLISKMKPGVYSTLLLPKLADAVGIGKDRFYEMIGDSLSAPNPELSRRRSAGSSMRRRKGAKPTKSAVGAAISVVINYPESALEVDPNDITDMDRRGVALLKHLIEAVRADQTMTASRLVERFRNDEHGRFLGGLVEVSSDKPDDYDAAAELKGAIFQIQNEHRKRINHELIEKYRENPNSTTEKDLIRSRLRRPIKNG